MAIFVGAFTLTLTNGLGDGLKDYIEKEVKNFEGNDIFFVRRKFELPKDNDEGEVSEYVEQKEEAAQLDPNTIVVTLEQIEQLAKEFPEVKSVSPNYGVQAEYISLDGAKKYKNQVNAIGKGVIQKLENGRTNQRR